MMTTAMANRRSESGMTLLAVMGIMAVLAIGLLAVAPSVQVEVQRQKEVEAIARGEEVAEAIRQYVIFYQGQKLPNTMDDLLDGLPEGTKKRQILRPSAAVDPLSEDGKWRLVKPDVDSLGGFAKRVQEFNGGLLPSTTDKQFQRWALIIVNLVDTKSEDDVRAADTNAADTTTDTPFIGVASHDTGTSVVAYYGIENHSKWIFTPLFRGAGVNTGNTGRTNFGANTNSSTK